MSKGVKHVSPGDYRSVELLALLLKNASKSAVLILDNILQPAMLQLR
jgi:hypothetical protein